MRDSYQYHREADDRFITRLRSPSPERPRWTDRDLLYNRSLDRDMMMMGGPDDEEEYYDDGPMPIELPLPASMTTATTSTPALTHRRGLPSSAAAMSMMAASNLASNLRESIGLPGSAGRRLPQPPPEAQGAMMMPHPHKPIPGTQNRPERLTTRNRILPQIPLAAPATSSSLTNSLFGFAKKLTGNTPTTHHPPPLPGAAAQPPPAGGRMGLRGAATAAATAASMMRSSQSFNQGPPRPGRGAKLPPVPMGNKRRQLPDRSGFYSRSLENNDYGPHNQPVNTVLEAGRGVRKLPVPMVKSATNGVMSGGGGGGGGGQFEQMLFNSTLR